MLTSLVRADGLLVVPATLEGHDAGAQVEVRLLRDLDAVERTIVAIGSHDPVLDLAASLLRARDPLQTLVSGPVGSLSGLVALRDGLCHLSGCHLLDPDSGEYTLPWIERVLPGQAVEVVRLVHREQGLIVAAGNPLGVEGLADLPRLRYVNRQRGAGTRVLLDHELEPVGIEPASVDGYEREEPTHLAVAAAVAAGRADTGLGVMAAARAFGLDFVPVAREPFDLVMRPGEPAVAPLLELMRDDGLPRAGRGDGRVLDGGDRAADRLTLSGRTASPRARAARTARAAPRSPACARRCWTRRARSCARSSGSTSGIARRSAGSGFAWSHVWAVTPGRPVRACATSVETEFVSTAGCGDRARRGERVVDDAPVLHVGGEQAQRQLGGGAPRHGVRERPARCRRVTSR